MGNALSIIMLISITILCCNSQVGKEIPTVEGDSAVLNKLVLYTEDSAVKNSRQELFVKNLAQLMGMPAVQQNDADLYLRIWFWDVDNKYVVNLIKKGKNYSNQVVEFWSKKIDSSEYIFIHREWKNMAPGSGWENLWRRVQELQQIDDGKKFEELKSQLTQMSYVQFEIGGQGKYRYFEYLQPSFYRYVDSNSGKIYSFLMSLNEELNIKVYNPADKLYLEKEKE